MAKLKNIATYSANELRQMRDRGASQTNLAMIRERSDAEHERAALEQLREDHISADWFQDAEAVMPETKKLVSLRLDNDVLDWFRGQGPGYQTRINAVLKAYKRHASSR